MEELQRRGLFLKEYTGGTLWDHLGSPKAVLGRGYALVQNAEGHLVTGSKQLKARDKIRIEFGDGAKDAVVED